jgi:hypothetical protein
MTQASRFVNDGSPDPPKLRVYLNLGTLDGLPPDGAWPGLDGLSRCQRLLEDGFEGVQLTTDEAPFPNAPFPHCGLDRINNPCEADMVAAKHAARGDLCLTVHLGWGLEGEDGVLRLVEATLNASIRHRLPIFIETHRATITQDLWRTIEITRHFPEVRFNGDFSHYYCGQELVYGDWNAKLAFMEPIFQRIGFLHGRVASPGCMQVPIGDDFNSRPAQAHGVVNFVEHFRELWTRAMRGFLASAGAGDVLIFAPELLSGEHYYARMFPDPGGQLAEECDRYAQALLYKKLARICFQHACQELADLPGGRAEGNVSQRPARLSRGVHK